MASATVEAIYQDGVLKPLQTLELSDNTHVWVQVIPIPSDEARAKEERLKLRLLELGVLHDIRESFAVPEEDRTPVQVKGKPLSETIIEERG